MNQFDSNLTKNLEDFMESYKMVDIEQIYSNGTEFVPIFRVKQWLEYNNINNLQSKIDKAIEYIEKDILNEKIEKVDWDFDDCYFSDMPAERIKPLIDILKEDK